VWYEAPPKESMPANFGVFDADSAPTPVMRNRVVTCSPPSAVTVQVPAASSQAAAATAVLKVISRLRSNRSATCSR